MKWITWVTALIPTCMVPMDPQGMFSCDMSANADGAVQNGTVCTLTCNVGYEPSTATGMTTCMEDGQFADAPVCRTNFDINSN